MAEKLLQQHRCSRLGTRRCTKKDAVRRDIIFNKVTAMKRQAPEIGVYMNEADSFDPDWEQDFYGTHYDRLLSIKQKRDPDGVFYCPTCVGSASWTSDAAGRLFRVKH